MKPRGRWLLLPLSALLLAYPFMVFVSLQHVGAATVGGILFALVVARYAIVKVATPKAAQVTPALKSLLPLTLVGVASGVSMLLSNHPLAVRLNPVWISLTMLAVFGWSLYSPPSMIERFARLTKPQLPSEAIAYTRRVTQVWCVFFVINAAVALWTAVAASLQVWTLYNGLVSYLLMGLLLGIEFLVRLRVQRRPEQHQAQSNAAATESVNRV
jgi:uncharacterized membrane protein